MKFSLKFPFVEQLRELLHAAPFSPFTIRLHDGKHLRVTNPDYLSVTMSGWVIWDDGRGYRHLNPTLIASIDELRSAKRGS